MPSTEGRDQDRQSVRLAFAGDLFLGNELVGSTPPLCSLLNDIRPVLDEADLVFCNLEGPLAQGPHPRQGVSVRLANSPQALELFSADQRTVVSLANNHMMDYGEEGLKETLRLLDEHGIHYVGAGINALDARRETTVSCNGRTIGFLAVTTDEGHVGSVLAYRDRPGCAPLFPLQTVLAQVTHLKQSADAVCVSVHWGHEYFAYPSTDQREVARFLVDAGADYVIGHHPHVIQGIERRNDSLIMYSLSNLFFSLPRSVIGRPIYQKRATREFLVVSSRFAGGRVDWKAVGGMQGEGAGPSPYRGRELDAFRERLRQLSRQYEAESYDVFWGTYRRKRERQLLRESLVEAFEKVREIPLRDLARTITLDDVRRNVGRLWRLAAGYTNRK